MQPTMRRRMWLAMQRRLVCTAVLMLTGAHGVAAQERFEDLARMFDYSPATALDVRQQDSALVDSVVVRDISYASPQGGRVPAYLVVPVRAAGPFAGIVFVHWGQGNRSEFVSEAIALAHRGAESLLIDAPFNRLDDPNRDKPVVQGEHDGYVQLVIDIRRGIDLLRSHAEVDASRIGYVGHSLGATWGGVVAGIDHRVKALVLMGGLPTLTDYDFPDPLIRQQALSRKPADREAYERALTPINPVRFVGHSSPAVLFFQWATFDRYISRRAAKTYFDAAGEPKSQQWYVSSHEFNDPHARTDRDEFLAVHLGLTQ
jgi:dienelactone hydrolase